jgi:cystathionine gamma-synthase
LAAWLNEAAKTKKGKSFDGVPGGVVKLVLHGSLQDKTVFDPTKQHEGGYGPCFAIVVGLVT